MGSATEEFRAFLGSATEELQRPGEFSFCGSVGGCAMFGYIPAARSGLHGIYFTRLVLGFLSEIMAGRGVRGEARHLNLYSWFVDRFNPGKFK